MVVGGVVVGGVVVGGVEVEQVDAAGGVGELLDQAGDVEAGAGVDLVGGDVQGQWEAVAQADQPVQVAVVLADPVAFDGGGEQGAGLDRWSRLVTRIRLAGPMSIRSVTASASAALSRMTSRRALLISAR